MPELQGEAQVGRQQRQEVGQQLRVALQMRRQLEQHRAEPARRAQWVDGAQEDVGGLAGVLQPQDVGDAHVAFDGEDEARPRLLHPVRQRGGRRHMAECVVDLDAIEPLRVALQKRLCGRLIGIELRLPLRAGEAGRSGEELVSRCS